MVAELETTAAHYRLLADNMADVVWVFNLDAQRFTYVSPSVRQLRGYTPEEVLTQTMAEVVTPASLAMIQADLPSQLAAFFAGEPAAVAQTHDIEQIRKDGSTVWTEVVTTLMQNAAGGLDILGVSRDIATRKQAEEALKKSEQKLRTLFEILPVGVSILNVERQIVYMNPRLEEILSMSHAGLLRGDYAARQYLRPDGTPMLLSEFSSNRALQEQHAVYAVETGVVKEDGTIVWINVNAVPVDFPDWRVVVVSTDITARKQAEETLREQIEMLRLAYAAADLGI
ncbi:diguanylate cyclase/phosphodiesterase with PAS/PAC sensor(S) [Candidatus Moduliflexus flocculans]|uniref:Diguanylate cyclase/phosphodiesterase with PAS/PAC sensor(S) n=1 Tax=Candidatus Moduliflexus flocculans TaxID=1499966 RepID=A0A081BRL4_9BACT|nr:diguanylate cyclase/phosphodiesterase with PAS/PAC sensor(S) [Candidatus Moduliflexus flocculans]